MRQASRSAPPTSGPLYMLMLLPGLGSSSYLWVSLPHFIQVSAQMSPSQRLCLCITVSGHSPPPRTPPPSTDHYLALCYMFLPLTAGSAHKSRTLLCSQPDTQITRWLYNLQSTTQIHATATVCEATLTCLHSGSDTCPYCLPRHPGHSAQVQRKDPIYSRTPWRQPGTAHWNADSPQQTREGLGL